MEVEWELTKETIYLPLGCLQGGLCSRFWAERTNEEERSATRASRSDTSAATPPFSPYLSQCIISRVLESQLLHKFVMLVFTIAHQNSKFTVLWGVAS